MAMLHQFVNMVANPLGITLGFAILGLMMLRKSERRKKWGWWVICIGAVVTMLMGMNPVTEVMAWWLEKDYPAVRVEELPPADAIVLLGGGVSGVPEGSSAPYPNLLESADRVWHAARIWRMKADDEQQKLKIYCTCPDVSRSTPPFLRDLGVDEDCIVPLDGPWNTESEAREIERALAGSCSDGRRRVYLVTSAAHMKRAMRIFRKYAPSVDVVPAATDHILVDAPNEKIKWLYFVPNIGAYGRFSVLLHEYLGLMRYW